jgi:hypothetical protein
MAGPAEVWSRLDVRVGVSFDDGSTSESASKLDSYDVGKHREGDLVPVRCDPRDHSKIAIDVPALAAEFERQSGVEQAEEDAEQARADAEKADAIARAEAQLKGGETPEPTSD